MRPILPYPDHSPAGGRKRFRPRRTTCGATLRPCAPRRPRRRAVTAAARAAPARCGRCCARASRRRPRWRRTLRCRPTTTPAPAAGRTYARPCSCPPGSRAPPRHAPRPWHRQRPPLPTSMQPCRQRSMLGVWSAHVRLSARRCSAMLPVCKAFAARCEKGRDAMQGTAPPHRPLHGCRHWPRPLQCRENVPACMYVGCYVCGVSFRGVAAGWGDCGRPASSAIPRPRSSQVNGSACAWRAAAPCVHAMRTGREHVQG